MSTKIHTASVSEHRVLEVFLTGGQEGDAPAGEELLAEVLAYEEVEAVGGDRAYDSDTIRALIAAAGKEAVGSHGLDLLESQCLFEQFFAYGRIAFLSAAQADFQRLMLTHCHDMDFRAQAAAAATESLIALFLRAPAAC